MTPSTHEVLDQNPAWLEDDIDDEFDDDFGDDDDDDDEDDDTDEEAEEPETWQVHGGICAENGRAFA